MLKRQNIKSKIASGGSCLLLLLLAFAFLNPVSAAVYAEEVEAVNNGGTDDGEVETYAMTTSTVNISFLPTSANGTMTPVDSNGAKAKVDVLATVRVQNSGGYKVYIGSNSSQLKDGDNVIDSVTSATTYANLPLNRWGYSFQEGATAKDSYEAMPATLRGEAKYFNADTRINDETKTFTLSFAANIGSDMPAGVYSNQVTMSVVSSPLEVTSFTELVAMQEMTSDICASSIVGDTAQLKDIRDGKYYWVAKLADGNCWMTQNLDLDIPSGGFTSNSTIPGTSNSYTLSDMSEAWTNPTAATTTKLDGWYDDTNVNRYTESRSWDQGMYVLNTPTAGISCNNDAAGQGMENCLDAGFVDVSSGYTASKDPDFIIENGSPVDITNKVYDAHYLVGNWYQWNAAVAGTGDTLMSVGASGDVVTGTDFVDAPSSICPKGWRLPKSGSDGTNNYAGAIARDDSFKSLFMQYNPDGFEATTIQSDVLVEPPLYFVRSGYVRYTGILNYSGEGAAYWSSTAYTNTNNAYFLYFSTDTNVLPANDFERYFGRSVRCVAR